MPKTYRSPVQDIAAPIMGLLFLALASTPLLTWPGGGGTAGKTVRVIAAILAAGLGLAMIVLRRVRPRPGRALRGIETPR